MHLLLTNVTEERALFLNGLEMLSRKLERLGGVVAHLSAAVDGKQNHATCALADGNSLHPVSSHHVRIVQSTDGGNERVWRRGAESWGRSESREEAGSSLAATWVALRAKQDECEMLSRLLRKLDAAWHTESKERDSEKEALCLEAMAAVRRHDATASLLQVVLPNAFSNPACVLSNLWVNKKVRTKGNPHASAV